MDLATSSATRVGGSTSDAQQAAAAISAFGLDLFRTDAYATANTVFSPTSIALALSMAREGAKGETAAQMDAVMHSAVGSGGGNGMNALSQALVGLSGKVDNSWQPSAPDLEVTLRIANAPFAQRGLKLEQPYLDRLASNYGAGIRLVDFSGDSEGACRLINGWVSDQTEKRIPKLLNQLDPATRLVLVNAIYLKAPWAQPFDPSRTGDAPFNRLDGSQVVVATMSQTLGTGYAQGSGWQAAEIDYQGKGPLTMTIIVPDDMAAFRRTFGAAEFDQITGAMTERMVDLTLPKFKIDKQRDIAPTLTSMGMPLAFGPGADFSGITTQERLVISAVVHQATISVDEKGTEATAATGIPMAASLPSPAELHANRPFIFAIRDRATGAILFLGRVVDPSV